MIHFISSRLNVVNQFPEEMLETVDSAVRGVFGLIFSPVSICTFNAFDSVNERADWTQYLGDVIAIPAKFGVKVLRPSADFDTEDPFSLRVIAANRLLPDLTDRYQNGSFFMRHIVTRLQIAGAGMAITAAAVVDVALAAFAWIPVFLTAGHFAKLNATARHNFRSFGIGELTTIIRTVIHPYHDTESAPTKNPVVLKEEFQEPDVHIFGCPGIERYVRSALQKSFTGKNVAVVAVDMGDRPNDRSEVNRLREHLQAVKSDLQKETKLIVLLLKSDSGPPSNMDASLRALRDEWKGDAIAFETVSYYLPKVGAVDYKFNFADMNSCDSLEPLFEKIARNWG